MSECVGSSAAGELSSDLSSVCVQQENMLCCTLCSVLALYTTLRSETRNDTCEP